jgi:ABC-type phosphate transport system substrate-binding protein
MQPNQTQVCRYCSYDLNPIAATRCEICNQPLTSSPVVNRRSPAWRWVLSLIVLVLLSSGLYLLWRNLIAPAPQTKSNQFNQVAGLQLKDSMQDVQDVPTGLFSYGGAQTFAALTAKGMNDAITKAYPQFRLIYTEPLNSSPGSGVGISMLIDKQLSIAQSGRSLKDEEYAKAQNRGFRLEQIPVAIDGIVFYTHPGLPIKSLTIPEVQSIFQGKIKNWKAVGGPDLPIVAIALNPKLTSSIQILFQGLENDSLGSNVQIVRDFTAAIRTVAKEPGGISYASAPIVIGQKTIHPLSLAKGSAQPPAPPFVEGNQVNEVAFRDGTYPLTRRLFVVFRRDKTIDELAGVAYTNLLLSKEGQAIIQKAGFVPIRQ